MIQNLAKLIEKPTCFSQTSLWKIVKKHYISQGSEAWNSNIPYIVTNACPTAYFHALQILQHAKGNYTIIDYGAGIGKHAYHLATYLEELCPLYGKSIDQFTLIMADLSQDTLNFWETQPKLKPFIESGLIKPHQLSGDWIADLKQLIGSDQHCLIANYLLDSMPFIAYEHNLKQGLSLYAPRKHANNPDPSHLKLKTSPLPKTDHPYPQLEKRYQNLHRYTLPSTAIDFLKTFFDHSQDSLVIINDKMFLNPQNIHYDALFNLTFEGSYSSSVNFDAICQTLSNLAIKTINHLPYLQTAVLSHQPLKDVQAPCCSDIASLFAFYKQQSVIPSTHVPSIMKSLQYDPFCLELISQSIQDNQLPLATLQGCISKCEQHVFPHNQGFSLLHSAKILRQCQYFEAALEKLNHYRKTHSDHPAYQLELGILYHQWEKPTLASEHLRQALSDPKTASTAKKLLEKIKRTQ